MIKKIKRLYSKREELDLRRKKKEHGGMVAKTAEARRRKKLK